MTQVKAGFLWSGVLGNGIIIKRCPGKPMGWSAPSSVATGGVGFGFQIGAQKTDTVIVLNDDSAVRAFSGSGQLKIGADVSVAAGPVGRSVAADLRAGDKGFTGCFSYSHSQGLFAGMSLEGAVLLARDSDNKKFYGQDLTVEAILNGGVEPPLQASPLYAKLNELCGTDATARGGGSYSKDEGGAVEEVAPTTVE